MRFIKITTENQASIINLPGNDYKGIANCIGADMIEHVRIKSSDGSLVIICDEEGLLKPENRCNPAASMLYGTLDHGHPIAGDILIAKTSNSPERDYEDFTDADAKRMVESLTEAIKALNQSGLSNYLRRKYDNSKPTPPMIISLDEYLSREIGRETGTQN